MTCWNLVSRQLYTSREFSLGFFQTARKQFQRKLCSVPNNTPRPSKPPTGGCSSSSSSGGGAGGGNGGVVEKQSLFVRFKAMYKDYYYVLIPVHLVTSVGWFGAFYHTSKSGVDIGRYMKKVGLSDSIVSKVTESGMGHLAVAYALYKIATPLRYTVTLGGTTWSINRLKNMGYIKPAKHLINKGKERFLQNKGKIGKE